jgi:Protein of unknown function (DUF4013)
VIIIETLSLSDAFKYPFKNPIRLLYALLLIIPILGPLTIGGYVVRLVNEFIEGRYDEPVKLDIIEDLKLGIIMFLKAIPFIVASIILFLVASYINTTLGIIFLLLEMFIAPILIVNFFRKQTIESLFEFDILRVVKDNFGDYIVAFLKQLVLSIIFLILSFILIGIPALYFTNSIFIANLYGNFIEQKHPQTVKAQSNEPLIA